uniref:Nuclear nucleic acid-binding protein C1D n=1 Tax=Hordeum vulgare subsp. vulgare TaxID=112509 RepID=A1C0L6_HORVV|nr:Putative protein [Hordeum vulgare subsp. vulgare]
MDGAAPVAGAPPAVPPAVLCAAEEALAATESVGDRLAEMLAAAAEDPDAVAELPPLHRARAFLAVAHAATSLFSGTGSRLLLPPYSSRWDALMLVSLPLLLERRVTYREEGEVKPVAGEVKSIERMGQGYLTYSLLCALGLQIGTPLRPSTTVNTQAAARFIGRSLSHLTDDQRRGMQAISKGEGAGWSGRKRKSQPLPERKSVRAAAEEFLAKASQELIGHNGSGVKGPVRLVLDEDED